MSGRGPWMPSGRWLKVLGEDHRVAGGVPPASVLGKYGLLMLLNLPLLGLLQVRDVDVGDADGFSACFYPCFESSISGLEGDGFKDAGGRSLF